MDSQLSSQSIDGGSSEQNAGLQWLSASEQLNSSAVAPASRRPEDPVITRYRAALQKIQFSELERLYNRLPNLDDGSRQAIGHFADCLVAQMLYPPLNSVQDDINGGSPNRLRQALEELFRLKQ